MTDWLTIHVISLSLACLIEAAIIAWLIWLNTTLLDQTRTLHQLLEDTAAIPLDLPLTKDTYDRRP